MSNINTAARPSLNLRPMIPRDLTHVLPIAKNVHAAPWTLKHFSKVFQSGDAAGWIAEKDGRVVGFAVYSVSPQSAGLESQNADCSFRRLAGPEKVLTTDPQCVNLHNIVVLPEWRRQGIGRSMMEILDQGPWRAASSVQILVPETNLPLQLFLRAVGYKAIRVVRDCFDGEDAYLMERQHDSQIG